MIQNPSILSRDQGSSKFRSFHHSFQKLLFLISSVLSTISLQVCRFSDENGGNTILKPIIIFTILIRNPIPSQKIRHFMNVSIVLLSNQKYINLYIFSIIINNTFKIKKQRIFFSSIFRILCTDIININPYFYFFEKNYYCLATDNET